jgi:chemotaxis family two-component system response regulator Rcp1
MPEPIQILLIEDSPSDQLLAQSALAETDLPHRLQTVPDGEEALAYLRSEGCYQAATRPDLILLDLNLPRKDGREVLSEIKAHDELKRIPVVVLTTSAADADIEQAYALHANCYITKPVDFDDFKRAVRSIRDFWFNVVRLPGQRALRLEGSVG